jgi:hypothetical protein
MSILERRGAIARLGVVAALVAGACGATGVAADAAPPLPPPPVPPGAPASAPAAPGAAVTSPAPLPSGTLAAPAEPWDTIARCETGGDWHADTGNGYQGGLQLSPRTWSAYGGGQFAPQADDASREQQILVGDRVRAEQGWQAWSNCADDIAPR